ncbi:MAG TPA: adenylate/guanylate cyclase domain-containing protein [Dehalococcoidia bacterium]|nr:adenylate/guanylate cyclase domain-containing protein [Dehalococcoidia bacterium]
MDPVLHYARTSDGVGIAYTVHGSGPPIVFTTAAAFGNVVGEWRIPEVRRWYEKLARRFTIVRYDGRETGSSDRNAADLSLEAHALDLEAVVDKLRLDSFFIFGFYHTSLAAIVYAARHAERVRKMVLWHGYARAVDHATPQVVAVRSLRDASWEVYTETLARTSFGWDNAESSSLWARMVRDSVTAAGVARWLEGQSQFDVSAYLPLVKCPTLLLYRKDARRFASDLGIALASQIGGAQLQLLPGDALMYTAGDADGVMRIIEEFFSDEGERYTAPRALPGSIVTILFTDLENHTELMHRLGDERGRSVLREHETIVREALRRHGGTEVKTLGDGFMASFGSASRALDCAIEMQQTFAARNQRTPEPLHVRIGVNAGEPIAEDDDLFGSAVILAARTASKAKGGEIVVTDVVRQLAAGKGFLFSDLGETEMRGFEDPVRLYELRWS